MLAVKGFYNGDRIVPLEKIIIKENQKVIITVLDEYVQKKDCSEKPHRKFMGKLDDDSSKEILEAIEDCERVDIDEW